MPAESGHAGNCYWNETTGHLREGSTTSVAVQGLLHEAVAVQTRSLLWSHISRLPDSSAHIKRVPFR